jgi:two-component system response regulator YesN
MDSTLMLQDVARAVNMSNSRFSTVFSQQSGKTFTEYLTALRIHRAQELLRDTDLRSSQIAFEVGFNDSHYFSYLFKKSVGMTPGEYRQQNHNQPE